MRGILRRIQALEERVLPNERLPALPLWYIRALEAHLGVPVDGYGRADSVATRRMRELQGLTDDSASGGIPNGCDTKS